MLEGEYELAAAAPSPERAAVTTFLAFLATGVIPLLPFLYGSREAFVVSVAMPMMTFFAIGALKSIWSLSPLWRSAGETLLIGGLAAAIAFFVGSLFHT